MMGRPPIPYDPLIGEALCERIASGETLVAICRDPGMPSASLVIGKWMDDPDFNRIYARAKRIRLDVMAEEITQLADECRPGKRVEEKQIGWRCSICDHELKWRGTRFMHVAEGQPTPICSGAAAVKVTEDKVVTSDMVDRSRLQIDARKWLLAKLASKTYGDRLVMAGDPDAPLISWADTLRARRAKRAESEAAAKETA